MKNAVRFSSFLVLLMIFGVSAFAKSVIADYDGDGKSDYVTVRADGDKLVWWISYSNAAVKSLSIPFGSAGDKLVPADYDGDGKTDMAVWRPASATFYIMQSKSNSPRIEKFGLPGDDPSIIGDYDGDGKADIAVYRPGPKEKPQSYFYYRGSATNAPDTFTAIPWGLGTDVAFVADFDGDGKMDLGARRSRGPTEQTLWYLKKSKEGEAVIYFGIPEDFVNCYDFDGDGKADMAVMRSSDDGVESRWLYYQQLSGNGMLAFRQFGLVDTDLVVPGDYDGDGRIDIGLWRKTTSTFWVQSSNVKYDTISFKWGNNTDMPVSVPRGK